MPFSRSQRSGPLSRRSPAIDSQRLTKYAPLLVKANSVYNSEMTAFLKSATPASSLITSKNDANRILLELFVFSFDYYSYSYPLSFCVTVLF